MAIIVEDGSIVANANSYVDLTTVRDYATLRGVTLDADDAIVEAQIVTATDYLETKEYAGDQVDPGVQVLKWPRKNVTCDGYAIPSDSIPQQLKDAQCDLVIQQHNGVDLLPTLTDQAVKRERVDVIEVEYQDNSSSLQTPRIPVVDNKLKCLLKYGGVGIIRTLRI